MISAQEAFEISSKYEAISSKLFQELEATIESAAKGGKTNALVNVPSSLTNLQKVYLEHSLLSYGYSISYTDQKRKVIKISWKPLSS